MFPPWLTNAHPAVPTCPVARVFVRNVAPLYRPRRLSRIGSRYPVGDVPGGAQDGAASDHQPNPPAMGHDGHVASPAIAPAPDFAAPAPDYAQPAHADRDAYAEMEAAHSGGGSGGGMGKWMLALAALAIIGGFGWWAWQWARVPQTAQIDATAPAEPVIAPPADWRPTYADTFLSDTVDMTTGVDANLRDYPSAEGTSITRIVPTGRRLVWTVGAQPEWHGPLAETERWRLCVGR